MGKTLFYPEGFCCFGNVEEMEFSLANYKQEIIHSVIVDLHCIYTAAIYVFYQAPKSKIIFSL